MDLVLTTDWPPYPGGDSLRRRAEKFSRYN